MLWSTNRHERPKLGGGTREVKHQHGKGALVQAFMVLQVCLWVRLAALQTKHHQACITPLLTLLVTVTP